MATRRLADTLQQINSTNHWIDVSLAQIPLSDRSQDQFVGTAKASIRQKKSECWRNDGAFSATPSGDTHH
jgi:hypothetical protein